MNIRKIGRLFIGIVILLIFNGCALYQYQVKTWTDKFDNYTIDRMDNNFLVGKKGVLGTTKLNVQRFEQGGAYSFSLLVEIENPDWLFIESGESLVLLIDGMRIGLRGEGSWEHRDVLEGGRIRELAWYRCSPGLIKKIAYAKEMKVKIIGKYYIVRYFNQDNFKNFQDFYEKYVKPVAIIGKEIEVLNE